MIAPLSVPYLMDSYRQVYRLFMAALPYTAAASFLLAAQPEARGAPRTAVRRWSSSMPSIALLADPSPRAGPVDRLIAIGPALASGLFGVGGGWVIVLALAALGSSCPASWRLGRRSSPLPHGDGGYWLDKAAGATSTSLSP